MSCIECEIPSKKYKCPNCLENYCSLECWKNHKSKGCDKKMKDDNEILNTDSEKFITPFKTEDTVDPQKLLQLGHNEELKMLLCNVHLRNLLKEIDSAPNAWKAMKAAMQEPLFIEFADECLKVVEPNVNDIESKT